MATFYGPLHITQRLIFLLIARAARFKHYYPCWQQSGGSETLTPMNIILCMPNHFIASTFNAVGSKQKNIKSDTAWKPKEVKISGPKNKLTLHGCNLTCHREEIT